MSFFIDDKKRRKSPVALVAFVTAILYLVIFGFLYTFLSEPLYHGISFSSEIVTTAIHSVIIAVIGTAICCLLFFLPDKRIVPYSFLGLAITLGMFYAAAFLLDAEMRADMLIMISLFGIAPVVLGNTVSWSIYSKMKRRNPDMNKRKTIEQELKEAIEKENAKKKPETQEGGIKASDEEAKHDTPETAEQKHEGEESEEVSDDPESMTFRPPLRSLEEEAAMFYVDDEEEDDC